jgi:hypothetical protein
MRVRADVDDIQTTRTEKLLAVVLAAFLLLGAIWTYQRVDDVVRRHVTVPSFAAGPATQRLDRAIVHAARADRRRADALQELELSREAYRTALDAGKPAAGLERQYNAARGRLRAAQQEQAEAVREIQAARPAALREQNSRGNRIAHALSRQTRLSFFARLGLVAFYILGAFALLAWARRRTSRWFPLAGSAVAAATIFTFVFACDYLTDYLDPFEWGIAAIAALGIAATLLLYWSVERYLLRRIPQRRVKRHQCPFCGYPVGANTHCEGCGREVVAPCTKCESPRRVGTPYCGVCGSTAGTSAA